MNLRLTYEEICAKLDPKIQSVVSTMKWESLAQYYVNASVATISMNLIHYEHEDSTEDITEVQPPLEHATIFGDNMPLPDTSEKLVEWFRSEFGFTNAQILSTYPPDQIQLLALYIMKQIVHSEFFTQHHLAMLMTDDCRFFINFGASDHYMHIIQRRIIGGANTLELTWYDRAIVNFIKNVYATLDEAFASDPTHISPELLYRLFDRESDECLARTMFTFVSVFSNLNDARKFVWNDHSDLCVNFCAPYMEKLVDAINDRNLITGLKFTMHCPLEDSSKDTIKIRLNFDPEVVAKLQTGITLQMMMQEKIAEEPDPPPIQ